MRRSGTIRLGLLAGTVCLSILAAATAEDLIYPVTVEKVWSRARIDGEKSKSSSGKGDLVIHRDRVEYVHGKSGWTLPWERIRAISVGKKKGDPDTDWVFLSVDGADWDEFVAVKDGRKFGFGAGTDRILETLRTAARDASAAQYDVPDGFIAYEGLDHLFTLGLPSSWLQYHAFADTRDGLVTTGTVVFYDPPPEEPGGEDRAARAQRALDEVAAGTRAHVAVIRRPADKKSGPEGLSETERETLRRDAETDSDYLGGFILDDPLRVEPVKVDLREGVRIQGRGRDASGAVRSLDLYAVADDGLLLIFRTIATGGDPGPASERLATVMETVKLHAVP